MIFVFISLVWVLVLSQFTNKMSNRLLIAVFLILGLNSIFCEKFRYNGYTVLRIRPQTQQQLDYLKDLSENNFEVKTHSKKILKRFIKKTIFRSLARFLDLSLNN